METIKTENLINNTAKTPRSHKVIIHLENIYKSFLVGEKRIKVLKKINLRFYSGEFAIIFGPSGCGKSTLLHTILGLEEPDRGKVYLRGKSLYQLSEDARTRFRREKVGMVFQQSNWIKSLSVWENVAYPLYLTNLSEKAIRKKALEMLKMVGMEENMDKIPTEMSGGEQQRVALARALITDPWILVVDEPTGNLDSKNGWVLINLLLDLNRKEGRAIIMVTHEAAFLTAATRRVMMKDGEITKDEHD